MQARWFDPLSGSFLSVDPVVPTANRPLSFNPYLYCRNNPLKFIDPDGNADKPVFTSFELMSRYFSHYAFKTTPEEATKKISKDVAKGLAKDTRKGVEIGATTLAVVSLASSSGTIGLAAAIFQTTDYVLSLGEMIAGKKSVAEMGVKSFYQLATSKTLTKYLPKPIRKTLGDKVIQKSYTISSLFTSKAIEASKSQVEQEESEIDNEN